MCLLLVVIGFYVGSEGEVGHSTSLRLPHTCSHASGLSDCRSLLLTWSVLLEPQDQGGYYNASCPKPP